MYYFLTLVIVYSVLLYFMWRNNAVYHERDKMIDWVFSQPDWQEKREIYKKRHTYNAMVFKFWRPVKWFFRDYLAKEIE